MNKLLEATPFSGNHNHKKDQQFLTKVFRKYTTLGTDANGDPNAKRVLTMFNAKWAAREIVRDWKGVTG